MYVHEKTCGRGGAATERVRKEIHADASEDKTEPDGPGIDPDRIVLNGL